MAIRRRKPTTPSQRKQFYADFSGLSKGGPLKSLTRGKKKISCRDSAGRISVRHRGGGHKRRYRQIDFNRMDKAGVPGTVKSLEYDPNRTSSIALIHYIDGEKRYILAPQGLEVGSSVVAGPRTKVKEGNRMELAHIPLGYKVYNIELSPGRGGRIVRSAGASATLMGFDGDDALITLPSSEVRKVKKNCCASIGVISNPEHNLIKIGKAGRKRWLGRRPQVLGKSMNAVDHPHGGGEGHTSLGMKKGPKTPWGRKALGVRTRRKHPWDSLIIRRRSRKKKKR